MASATRTRVHRLVVLAVAALVAVFSIVGPPSPARAAGASESACRNRPSNATCDGATFADTFDGLCWTSSSDVTTSSYVVNERLNDTVYWPFPAPNTGWTAYTQLWYSPQCRTNWAVVFLYYEDCTASAPPVWSAKVRRYAGTDGGYLMYHAQWLTGCDAGTYGAGVAVSPMVYSPDNGAQAVASLSTDDQYECTDTDQRACTHIF